MSTVNTGGPAFPYGTAYAGMTLRDYFAAKAMQAWVTSTTKLYVHDAAYQVEMCNTDLIAKHAYDQADAMLKAREA